MLTWDPGANYFWCLKETSRCRVFWSERLKEVSSYYFLTNQDSDSLSMCWNVEVKKEAPTTATDVVTRNVALAMVQANAATVKQYCNALDTSPSSRFWCCGSNSATNKFTVANFLLNTSQQLLVASTTTMILMIHSQHPTYTNGTLNPWCIPCTVAVQTAPLAIPFYVDH